jgi:hypothetical protein
MSSHKSSDLTGIRAGILAPAAQLRANAPAGQESRPATSAMLVSKNSLVGLKLAAFAGVLSCCLANQSPGAYAINWGADTWDHSSFGGSAGQVGWDKNEQGVWGGSSTYGPLTATVQVSSFGTANSRHTAFSPPPSVGSTEDYLVISPRPVDGVPEFNGLDNSTMPALVFGSVSDYNNLAGSLTNYSLLNFSFSSAVTATFILGDVDRLTSWIDLISVRAFSGGNLVTTLYTPNLTGLGTPYNQLLDTNFFPGTNDSVTGITGDAGNATADGEVGISFAGPVDSIDVYYWNGVSSASEHGVYLRQNSFQFVPEPNVAVLLGLGGLLVGFSRFRPSSSK